MTEETREEMINRLKAELGDKICQPVLPASTASLCSCGASGRHLFTSQGKALHQFKPD